jgi:hypothetical protein
LTGQDDLERVASRDGVKLLNRYLESRRLLIPRKPGRFLDAATFTQEELLELLRQEAEELSIGPFVPWILEVEGKLRLPAFSSQKKMIVFSGAISKRLGKVFALGSAEILFKDLVNSLSIDFVDLNMLSKKSWEIGIGELRAKD